MKILLKYLFAIPLFFSQLIFSQKFPEATSELMPANTGLEQEQLDLIIDLLKTLPENVELSIAVLDGEETTFVGVRREEDVLKSVDNKHSLFEIGSVSKTFTGVLLADMVQKKELTLETPIKKLLPVKMKLNKLNGEPIRLLHLTNHTSGLPRIPNNMNLLMNMDDPYKNYGNEKLYEYLEKKMKIKTTPGEKFAYSNLGAGMLGHIMELKTEMSYEELVIKRICEPLGMENTVQHLSEAQQKCLIKGINGKGKEVSNWNFQVLAAAGALRSNAVDMEKYVRGNWSNKPMFDLTHKSTHKIDEKSKIGMGWLQMKRPNGLNYHGHNGGTGGYRTAVFFDKTNQKGIIVLSNLSAMSKQQGNIDKIALQLLDYIGETEKN